MATKTTNGSGNDGDAPLIDLNEASIKKLIARAKKRGVITYDELNEALPQDQMSSEQIEDVMSAISEMGVNIVENDDDSEEGEETPDEIDSDDDDDTCLLYTSPSPRDATLSRMPSSA